MPPIAESRWSAATDTIVFTALTSCLTVTVVDPGGGPANSPMKLIGAHFVAAQTDQVFPILRGMRNLLWARTPRDIFMVGVLQIWSDENFRGEHSRFTAFNLLASISEIFGFPDDQIRVLQTGGQSEIVSFRLTGGNVTLHINGADRTNDAQPVM